MAKHKEKRKPSKKSKPQKKPELPLGQDPTKTFASHPHARSMPFEPMKRGGR